MLGGHRGVVTGVRGVSDTGCQRWTSRYAGWTQGCGHRGEGSVRYRLPEMDFEVF